MYLIKGHIISLQYFALSTSSFTVLILLNILYSCTLSGSGNQIKSNQINVLEIFLFFVLFCKLRKEPIKQNIESSFR